MGGGISVGAHLDGRVVDVNNALDGEGPFSPERVGTITAREMARLCFSGEYTHAQINKMIAGAGGVVAYLGTNDMREVNKMADAGDRNAALVRHAMAYNVGKAIGGMAAVLNGHVDAVILTGGIANNTYVCGYIKDMVSFMSEVVVMPGEDELGALAMNAMRVLKGETEPKIY